MVITSRTHTTLFASTDATSNSGSLVRLPLSVVPHYETRCQLTGAIVPAKPLFRTNLWSSDEHERFLHGLEMFPTGPWKEVAKVVGTKSTRQTMTHAQKYRQKIERRMQAKPKASKQQPKSRRCVLPSTAANDVTIYPASALSEMSTMSFVEELLSCNPIEAVEPMQNVTSPVEVHTDAFDNSFLDLEFDKILAAFEPTAQYQEQTW
jgi:SHAQKYF class myb-like DNA-binding protein